MIYEVARFDPPDDGRHIQPLIFSGDMVPTETPWHQPTLVVTGDRLWGVTLTRDDVLDLIEALSQWIDDVDGANPR